ncbi:Wadjet anti-phage system protein JetD domain-containing protein [Nocardioides massiliensis]|uniref:DUF3322 and DUF2220 domain-containing protein n=1 Tax=Nocardioides massiliensis TaxID=1325935 RepID=A0ABT9NUP8_9ACTN|nr:DUF3322 and DUF2220 domain-containing protein [Nocardioides massiliensis]MDP9823997.1 hypothetical protein [Nocardioides massiliensis]
MAHPWTRPADIAAKVRRRWDDGSLLRAFGAGEEFGVLEVPVRGPRPGDIGDDLDAVRAWIAELDDGRRGDSRYGLVWGDIGGRHIGRNRIPTRAVLQTYDQAWALLGVRADVERFTAMLAEAESAGALHAWVLRHPVRALAVADVWPGLVAAYSWLDEHRGSGRHLREISAPGVDTKFAERHRAVLASMLEVGGSARAFVADLGLRSKAEFVRLRAGADVGLPASLSEVAVRVDELARWGLRPQSALIVENEITYLSVPVPERGMVLWGKGFEVDRIGRLPWLAGVPVAYWGDLDTHGFAILDRLRAWLPHAESVLMDRETLLGHRDRWGREASPARSQLTRLTSAERDLYEDLVTDRHGEQVRLEQERIDWKWALARMGQLR